MPESTGKVIDIAILAAETRAGLERLEQVAVALVDVLYDPAASDETHDKAAELLIAIGPAAVDPLVHFIRTDPKRGRTQAASVLCEIGEAAVDALLCCFGDPDRDVRSTAAFLFTVLRDVNGVVEDAVVGLLDDDDELVRQSACYALAALDCHKAVPKLIAVATRPLELPDRDVDPEGWAEAFPYDCCAAVEALGQLGDARAVAPLLFVVDEGGPDGPLYDEAVRALGLLRDARAVNVVRRAFDGSPYEGQFTDALAAIDGRGALGQLLELAESEDPDARRGVCEQLMRLGTPVAADAVAHLLVDPDENVRRDARRGLYWTVDADTAGELIDGLEDPSAERRAWTTNLLPVLLAWSD
jgi:HEAT repeat protein